MDIQDVLLYQYVTQHFEFHPRTLCDLIYNVFYENLSESLNQLKQFLIQEFNEIVRPHVIQAQTDNIMQELVKKCDKSMDKLELYLNKNIFNLPPHAVLPEDEIHIKNPHTKEEEDNLDKEIEQLKKQIEMEIARKHALKEKIKEQDKVKKYLISVGNNLKSLSDTAAGENITEETVQDFFSDITELCTDM